jgi:hypothetical protein
VAWSPNLRRFEREGDDQVAKEYRIKVYGEQREVIDPDLMARLVLMLGRQLANEARDAAEAAHARLDALEAQDAAGLVRLDEMRRAERRKAADDV